ncbi:branched-chain amino acid ABC transporter substrate-binding protein [Acidovorax sp. SUPP2825]|uniref:branched-chain amino acid ABC transporter substrate-binding protein n=1 Tax=Acidovorax sp. SUPP2825 TaxID=2920879 RepID=UPI0023DE1BFD|nr:branched-chain amino acid ABC transporter substrate-binding protein [Acidovorax sp. SUPP2825]GKS97641.1 branched-chain amino acid ABC transporter substrate-binding protein [Acidovorax sp. SUPP2825]
MTHSSSPAARRARTLAVAAATLAPLAFIAASAAQAAPAAAAAASGPGPVASPSAAATAQATPASAPRKVAAATGAPIQVALIESMSGPFANTGEAVFRNVLWATERVNARGGVRLPTAAGGARPLVIERYDSKGQNEEALSALRAAIDDGARVILQGNSSATAAVLIEAINKHNEREPGKRVLFLNYSAVDPILTNEKCSFWHFRFDAHADMRMAALMDVIREDKALKSVYLIGQDYSFGQAVLREARKQLAAQRPDVAVVGDELHPVGRVKDFAPYAVKIKASGAQAVVTGNWGNDLTLLVKAAREVGYDGMFYTFYGNALGAPAALGDAGVGKVVAVADWLPNVPGAQSEAFYRSFRQRFPQPADDYVHMRMQLMVETLAQSIERAGSTDATAVARAMETAKVQLNGQAGTMRAADHQFQQPLAVGVMDRQGAPGVPFDVEGSGYGFRVVRQIAAEKAEQPQSCKMVRSQ